MACTIPRLQSWASAVPIAGLGLYEYMLLSEELGAEPIWVINNGIRRAFLLFPCCAVHTSHFAASATNTQPAG